MKRRRFLRTVLGSVLAAPVACTRKSIRLSSSQGSHAKPNIVFVLADQWRAQALGHAGDPNVRTPNLDRLAVESVRFTHAVSGCPLCSPHRASLMTGQYWLTHGVFLNDVHLDPMACTMSQALGNGGHDTGYIGKWHLDGHGRTAFIPRERRHGFQFWRAAECCHDYNNSFYYTDRDETLRWDGYDAIAQTREAQDYIRGHAGNRPFALFLGWGPPHDPYDTAPEEYRRRFDPEKIALRPNVPQAHYEQARKDLAGYYAHIAALDDCIGSLVQTMEQAGIKDNTILVFTSDHGDMLHSQGRGKKRQPFEESIRVPFLIRFPRGFGNRGQEVDAPINTPDIMPTLLGLCGIGIPPGIEGKDFSVPLHQGRTPDIDAALLISVAASPGSSRQTGIPEYRGVRTRRHTYVRDLEGPWLLIDNETDPYQLDNLCCKPECAGLQQDLDGILARKLKETHDEFRPGEEYLRAWNYKMDETGAVKRDS